MRCLKLNTHTINIVGPPHAGSQTSAAHEACTTWSLDADSTPITKINLSTAQPYGQQRDWGSAKQATCLVQFGHFTLSKPNKLFLRDKYGFGGGGDSTPVVSVHYHVLHQYVLLSPVK